MIGEILDFKVHSDYDGTKREAYHLDTPTKGLHIRNTVWREFTNFLSDDYNVFLSFVGARGK